MVQPHFPHRIVCGLGALAMTLASCASTATGGIDQPMPEGAPVVPDTVIRVDTVMVANSLNEDLDQRVARLQLELLDRDAQIGLLQTRLDETMQEVVRVMARQNTLASRAEAASSMSEAQIAVDALKVLVGTGTVAEVTQSEQLLATSTAAFNRENYGGALYLANEAKTVARGGESRMSVQGTAGARSGESFFSRPLTLETSARSNVREGPGLGFSVLFTLEPNVVVVGRSYTDEWVQVTTDDGRRGWIFHSLVRSRAAN